MESVHPVHSSQYNLYFEEELDINFESISVQTRSPYQQPDTPITTNNFCCCRTQSPHRDQGNQQVIHLSKPLAMSETSGLHPHIPCKSPRGRYTQPLVRYDCGNSSSTAPSNNINFFDNNSWVHGQPAGVWTHPHNLQSTLGVHDHKVILEHAQYPQNRVDEQNSANFALPRVSSGEGSYAFKGLPGYKREKNYYNLLDCFETCSKRRHGERGFKRRGNLIVHLRNCHHQIIPKYDRGGGRNRQMVQRRLRRQEILGE
ncbi:hypothetical protein P167DRAFT_577822 [Morchella conica CCBAS932]|uniref:Uncharacterized protein n=1 Tax=Morchella conica CCBAS932 TaxID=1392247 RepID=A0A3N4KE24_9PEZI|nr:hypothetical protein P167DRAFT_577822 [Morchella conica CCBAS932]